MPDSGPVHRLDIEDVPGEPLRFWVASRHQPGERYLVDLKEWRGNGACCCKWFVRKIEKCLRAGMTQAESLERKFLPAPKEGRTVEDLYFCEHLLTAHITMSVRTCNAIAAAERTHR